MAYTYLIKQYTKCNQYQIHANLAFWNIIVKNHHSSSNLLPFVKAGQGIRTQLVQMSS